jgi:hypothetical protein
MEIRKVYDDISKRLSDSETQRKMLVEEAIPLLKFKKDILNVLLSGKIIRKEGIGSGINYIEFFDKEGHCAIPKEYIREITSLAKESELNIVSLSEVLTVACPKCGSQTPYMQRVYEAESVYKGKLIYAPIVVHCDDVRKVESMEEKIKENPAGV